MNPILDVFREMGLNAETAAQATGLDRDTVSRLMTDPPPADAENAFKVLNALGTSLRIRQAEPLNFWVDFKHLFSMYYNNDFRREFGWMPYPSTRQILLHKVEEMRKSMSLEKIRVAMEESYIPTVTGCRNWRKSTILKQTTRAIGEDDYPVQPDKDYIDEWRVKVVDMLLANMNPYDSMATVRYGITYKIESGKLQVSSKAKVPLAPRQWMVEYLSTRTWLAGKWGEIHN